MYTLSIFFLSVSFSVGMDFPIHPIKGYCVSLMETKNSIAVKVAFMCYPTLMFCQKRIKLVFIWHLIKRNSHHMAYRGN